MFTAIVYLLLKLKFQLSSGKSEVFKQNRMLHVRISYTFNAIAYITHQLFPFTFRFILIVRTVWIGKEVNPVLSTSRHNMI